MAKENQEINYAYITPAGILKVTDEDVAAAKKYSKNGKVIETTIECQGGYPIITYNNKRQTVVVYGLDNAVVSNNSTKTERGTKINLRLYPEIYKLYEQCM